MANTEDFANFAAHLNFDMKKVKNLCFDLGGVIMNIRRADCISAYRRLGMDDPGMFLGEYVQGGPFAGLESGSLTPGQFRNALRPYLHDNVTDEQIDAALMAFLIGIPPYRLGALKQLRASGFGLYLLSNTNPIMWYGKIADEFRQGGEQGPEAYFDGIVTSFDAKVMKPDPKIFDKVITDFNIRPDETLFLDDSETNCKAAEQCGWHSAHIGQGAEFMDVLGQRTDLAYTVEQ